MLRWRGVFDTYSYSNVENHYRALLTTCQAPLFEAKLKILQSSFVIWHQKTRHCCGSWDNSWGWVPRGRIPGANPVLASRQLVGGWVDRRLADVPCYGALTAYLVVFWPILLRTETSFRAIGQGRVTVEAAILVCRNTWNIPLLSACLSFFATR